jgi:hypothetical protein
MDKNQTVFADVLWVSQTQTREFITLDFLSDKAAYSITRAVVNDLIDSQEETQLPHPDEIETYWVDISLALDKHALGQVLSVAWRRAFIAEFTDCLVTAMWRHIYRCDEYWDENKTREERYALIAKAREEKKIEEARRILAEVDNG